jgi:Zinc finger, C3HC4 type (RING finger)/IBR domain, a half RING-finger domain
VMHADRYFALQASIRDLGVKLQQVDIRLRVFTPPSHSNFRHIQVRGGDHIKSYKPMIDAILVGHVVTRDGKPLWDVDLESLDGPRLFSDLRMEGVHVFMDLRRQRIMLLCTEDRRAVATARIYRRFDEAKRRVYAHTFQRWQLRYFLDAIKYTIMPQFGPSEVLLDTRACRIAVGGILAGKCLRAVVSRAPHTNLHVDVPENTGTRCPVCLDVPVDPVSLSCQHAFCKSCLTQYILSATQPEAAFSIRCFGDDGQCTLAIPLNIIRRLLTRDEYDLATRRSLKLHVDSKPQEYRHCPTNDCPQIFRILSQTETPELAQHCPSCLNKFCPACFLEGGHDGITCVKAAEYQQLASAEEKQIVEEWVRNLGGRACPKCKMGLIKDGGCAHVQCSKCKVHICWTCGKTFDQVADESVYEHMRREHGSIGLFVDWEGEDWNTNNMVEWVEPLTVPMHSSGSSGGSPVAAQAKTTAGRSSQANGQLRRQNKQRAKKPKYRNTRFREYDDDGFSEDEDDDFGGGQWDYDFADVNWESL